MARTEDLRCLLFSPLPPLDPDNGDAQYTRDLLADPPPGVSFVHYGEALRTGALEHGPSLRPGRPGPRSVADAAAAVARIGLHGARRTGWLLPDPVRWLRVRERFDVVHVHCMPVRFLGPAPAVVATDSAGTYWYWTAARGIPGPRVEHLLRRERRLAGVLGYLHPTVRPEPAGSVLLFAPVSGRALLERIGVDGARVGSSPAGVPSALTARKVTGGSRILFVARNFELKGGGTVLEVFRRVRQQVSAASLVVAGCPDPDPGIAGVTWLGETTRDELYRRVYPQADVFLYPTTFDGVPLVVAEALANGLPVVAPAAFGLTDQVVDGVTGVLYPPGDVDAATAAVLGFLEDADRLRRASAAAVADFSARMSAEVRNDALLAAYRRAAGRRWPMASS